MRIQGLVDNNVYPPVMGHTVRVWHLYRALARQEGVESVRVVSALKSREQAPAAETRDGVTIARVKPYHPTVFAWLERAGIAPLFLAAEAYRLWPAPFRRAWDPRADVFEVDSVLVSPLLAHAPAGALKVYGSQNVELEMFESAGPALAGRARWGRRLEALERAALDAADLVIAVSDGDRAAFGERFGVAAGKIVVIENGFDSDALRAPSPDGKRGAREALGLGPDERGLLFVGTAVEHNRRAVEELFRHLVPHLAAAQARLFLVGGVSAGFRERAEREGGGRVRAVPAQGDLTPYLWGSDVGLNPVTTGAGSNVKLPMYLAAGLEVVTTPFGARGFERLEPHVVRAPVEEFARAVQGPFPPPGGRAPALASYAWNALGARLHHAFVEARARRAAAVGA